MSCTGVMSDAVSEGAAIVAAPAAPAARADVAAAELSAEAAVANAASEPVVAAPAAKAPPPLLTSATSAHEAKYFLDVINKSPK
jgi:hypothetical protein